MGQEVEDRVGHRIAQHQRQDEGDDGPDQPRAKLGQMLHQRRAAVVNVFGAHASLDFVDFRGFAAFGAATLAAPELALGRGLGLGRPAHRGLGGLQRGCGVERGFDLDRGDLGGPSATPFGRGLRAAGLAVTGAASAFGVVLARGLRVFAAGASGGRIDSPSPASASSSGVGSSCRAGLRPPAPRRRRHWRFTFSASSAVAGPISGAAAGSPAFAAALGHFPAVELADSRS